MVTYHVIRIRYDHKISDTVFGDATLALESMYMDAVMHFGSLSISVTLWRFEIDGERREALYSLLPHAVPSLID